MQRCCQSTGITDLMATCENLHTYKICPLIKNNFSDQTTNLSATFIFGHPLQYLETSCVECLLHSRYIQAYAGQVMSHQQALGLEHLLQARRVVSLTFSPPLSLYQARFWPFLKHISLRHHHCCVELCPVVEPLELTGSGHVQHGAALTSPCGGPCSPHCASTSPVSPSTGL